MKRLSQFTLLSTFWACVASLAFSQDSAHQEKVAEGQFWEWKDGKPIPDTTQSWTIWRTADGFEVEDKLPLNKAAVYAAVMGKAFEGRMSAELSEEMRGGSTTTDIHLQLSRQGAIQALMLNGKKLSDAKDVQVADCRLSEKEIACKGLGNSARLKNPSSDQLVYSYPFPLFFISILKQSKPAVSQTKPVKLAILEEMHNKLQLTEVLAQLRGEGRENLHVGEHIFETDKYSLAYDTKMGPRQITIWTSNQGTVFGMEDSALAPGVRVLLSQYKKYSDF